MFDDIREKFLQIQKLKHQKSLLKNERMGFIEKRVLIEIEIFIFIFFCYSFKWDTVCIYNSKI